MNNSKIKRPLRRDVLSCESLEGRVVFSNWGGADLLGGLSQIGVATMVMDAGGPRGGQPSQSDTTWQSFQTQVQTLAAKSDVTVADMSTLASDSQAITTAGGGVKVDALRTVLGTLAAAVAGGADTTQARADFNALFSSSKVDQATIDRTFNDLVQTIHDSNITTSDLTDFAKAVAALPNAGEPMHGSGIPGGPGGLDAGGPRGDVLAGGLAHAGVTAVPTDGRTPATGSNASGVVGESQSSSPRADLEKLRSDQQTVSAKSTVSSADLDQLKTDSQNAMAAGFQFDPKALQPVINGLVAAVAGGADTTQARADFNALFSSSKVDQATIDRTFNDLVQTIHDSNITADDASLIAKDQSAVQADLASQPWGGMGGRPWGGGMFGGGGMADQGSDAAGAGHAPGLSANPGSISGGAGASAAVPASSNDSVASQNVDAGPSAAASVSPVADGPDAGGRFRGGVHGSFDRTMRAETLRKAIGGSQRGGIHNRPSSMHQHGGGMNRLRRR